MLLKNWSFQHLTTVFILLFLCDNLLIWIVVLPVRPEAAAAEIQRPLELNLMVANMFIPDSGKHLLQVSIQTLNSPRNEHLNITMDIELEFCTYENNCHGPSVTSSTFIIADQENDHPWISGMRNNNKCRAGIYIPISNLHIDYRCANSWRKYRKWDPVSGTLEFNFTGVRPVANQSICNEPFWFRVTAFITSFKIVDSRPERLSTRRTILFPNPVHR